MSNHKIRYRDVANVVGLFPEGFLAKSVNEILLQEKALQNKYSPDFSEDNALECSTLYALCSLLSSVNVSQLLDKDADLVNALFNVFPKFFLDVSSWAASRIQPMEEVYQLLKFCNEKNLIDHEALWFEYLMLSLAPPGEQFKNNVIVAYLGECEFDVNSIHKIKDYLDVIPNRDPNSSILAFEFRNLFDKVTITQDRMGSVPFFL